LEGRASGFISEDAAPDNLLQSSLKSIKFMHLSTVKHSSTMDYLSYTAALVL